MTIQPWLFVIYLILALIAGLVIGFFAARKLFIRQMKKNPPVNRNQIRALYMQMGRKPSEKQIDAAMKAFNDAK